MFVFQKIWRALFFGNTRFEICPFALLPTKYCKCKALHRIGYEYVYRLLQEINVSILIFQKYLQSFFYFQIGLKLGSSSSRGISCCF